MGAKMSCVEVRRQCIVGVGVVPGVKAVLPLTGGLLGSKGENE